MRFDLGADVESIEGNNKSKRDNTECFCTPSQDCFQEHYEKCGTIPSSSIKRADTVYHLLILDCWWEHCSQRSYLQLSVMFALPVLTSLALCHQRAKTDNAKRWEWCCVPEFYGVVRFAIFSFCVLCCIAA